MPVKLNIAMIFAIVSAARKLVEIYQSEPVQDAIEKIKEELRKIFPQAPEAVLAYTAQRVAAESSQTFGCDDDDSCDCDDATKAAIDQAIEEAA